MQNSEHLKLSNSCLQIKIKLLEKLSKMRCEILLSTVATKSHNFVYCIRIPIMKSSGKL